MAVAAVAQSFRSATCLAAASRASAFAAPLPLRAPPSLSHTRARALSRTCPQAMVAGGNGAALSSWEAAVAGPTANTPAWLPHRVDAAVPVVGPCAGTLSDWVPALMPALSDAAAFTPPAALKTHPLRVLVLYGSLRETGFSKMLGYECARLLEGIGADVRVYDPRGLPVRDPALSDEEKVLELRALVQWSEAHVWVGAELHGNLCSVLKNQIDWIPLNTASLRPTQGKACAVLQVNGGSQSFNVVNQLRLLARWMRMPCITNQSSVPKAWLEFDEAGRMKDSSLRERVVDVMEEFYKFGLVNREYADFFVDRYSERKEREEKGRLLTQAEKEAEKSAAAIKAKANE